jgi:hypothetical protein
MENLQPLDVFRLVWELLGIPLLGWIAINTFQLKQWAFGVKGDNGIDSRVIELEEAAHRHSSNDQALAGAIDITRSQVKLDAIPIRLRNRDTG